MLQFPALSEDCNISHFVTTRQGGVSKGAYASFNPGEYSGDNPEAVRANRKLLSDAIGIPTERIFAPFQVHGAEIRSIEPSFLSLPLEEQQLYMHGVDALVTDVPEVCIAVSTADCVPVLLLRQLTAQASLLRISLVPFMPVGGELYCGLPGKLFASSWMNMEPILVS